MKTGKLIKDKYFFDDSESGLYFDLCPLGRGAGSEDDLSIRIGKANYDLECMNLGGVKRCTLFLTDQQLAKIPQRFKSSFAAKTYLMVFRSDKEVSTPIEATWSGFFADGFQWSSPDKVYTRYDANALAHRFRRATKQEVDSYIDPNAQPSSGNDVEVITSETVTIPTEIKITGEFLGYPVDLLIQTK